MLPNLPILDPVHDPQRLEPVVVQIDGRALVTQGMQRIGHPRQLLGRSELRGGGLGEPDQDER